jgi:hypothetical protein
VLWDPFITHAYLSILASTASCAKHLPHNFDDVRLIHGILASTAFVIFMPFGAIIIRGSSFKNLIWLHAGWMIFAYTFALAALGMGVWLAHLIHAFDRIHSIIGLAVIGAALLQPITGLVHHLRYKRTGSRNPASYLHIWLGRAIITLAIINGALGLQLATPHQPNSKTGEVVYAVVAGVMWLAWMVIILISFIKSRGVKEGETSDGEKQSLDVAHSTGTGSNSAMDDSVADEIFNTQVGKDE